MADRGRPEACNYRPAGGEAGIKRGRQPNLGQRKARHQPGEIGRRHMHIAIGDHQNIMLCGRQHVDQIADFTIDAVLVRADHHRHIDLREPRAQACDHGKGCVIG